MLQVVCVKSGSLYGPEYVNRLRAMVARNLDLGTEGRFTCFTDDATDLRADIHVSPLPEDLTGWWGKLWLFSPGLFDPGDRILYFDLDTVIVGALDDIAAYDGEFAILRDFYRPEGLQSSVMAWPAGSGTHIWEEWNRAGRPIGDPDSTTDHGDQAWIERRVGQAPVILQERFPGKFVSFKRDCIPFPPEDSSVCVFHGEPRPHNCGRPWVEAMWTESDTGHFQIAMVPNVDLARIREQIKHSATLDLTRLTSKPAHAGKVAIVGGGPSLGDAPVQASLSRCKADGFAIWALNGSFDWLRERGITADAHVVIDARLDNVNFLTNSSPETTYYIASQCNWVVFDKLLRGKRKIVRLDLDVMGDCGTTVGTHAVLTAFVEGFREIHLFGFDSSYRDEAGHAYQQPINSNERIVDAHIGDKVFRAAPWMVRQAQDFEGIARDVAAAGGAIVVHGDGLLPYMAKVLSEAPPRAATVRAQEVLKRLPSDEPPIGIELGVFRGEMSAELLKREDLFLTMVDSWEADGAGYAAESGDWHAKLKQADQDAFRKRAEAAVAFAGERAVIIPMRSVLAAKCLDDGIYDFVFIDADHSYAGCSTDIAAWAPKLKPGGLLSGHDYDNPDFPDFGVKRAVDEFAARHGHTVELGDNLTWFIRV